MNKSPSPRVVGVAAFTTAFEGFRAGASLFRGLLDMPARTQIGDVAFADLSKATDLSSVGVAFYVVFGIGGAVITLANFIVLLRAHVAKGAVGAALLSAICSVLILLFTTQAAPLMWRVGSAPTSDVETLHTLLDGFAFWTYPRFACAIVSFIAALSVLTALALESSRRGTDA